jgi:hypothetical protein
LIAVVSGLNLCHAQSSFDLTPQQEVTPPTPDADASSGFVDYSLSGSTLTIADDSYYLTTGAATAITVSDAPAGANGPTLFLLTPDNDFFGGFGTFSGSGTLTSGEITDLDDGNLYVNVETAENPAGEIRGQFPATTPVPEPATMTLMGVGSLVWLVKRRRKI